LVRAAFSRDGLLQLLVADKLGTIAQSGYGIVNQVMNLLSTCSRKTIIYVRESKLDSSMKRHTVYNINTRLLAPTTTNGRYHNYLLTLKEAPRNNDASLYKDI
jgi:hypothetical protein